MKLIDRTVADLLAAFRSPEPVPGGGSASALAGAVGAALLTMIASLPKHRASSGPDAERLRAAALRCAELSERLTALVDEDAAAYARVIEAVRLPKTTDAEKAERTARLQAALKGAIESPLDVMRRSVDAIEEAAVVAALGNPAAASDVGVALELLTASERGARLNVDINLDRVKDADYAGRVAAEVARLEAACERGGAAARAHLS